MSKFVEEVRNALKRNSDQKTKISFQRFFKTEVKYHGVKSAVVLKIAKEFFIRLKDKKEIFSLSEELLKSGYCEESWIAANWIYWHDDFKEQDF